MRSVGIYVSLFFVKWRDLMRRFSVNERVRERVSRNVFHAYVNQISMFADLI